VRGIPAISPIAIYAWYTKTRQSTCPKESRVRFREAHNGIE